jgi:deoxyribodipyrimidine photo-lyase
MAERPVLLWFRQDLRLADNPALAAAIAGKAPIVPLYILDDTSTDPWRPGAASRWWLHHSLTALDRALQKLGSRLVFRIGDAEETLRALLRETDAGSVFWNRCYEPAAIARDTHIKKVLTDAGLDAQSFNAALLHEPWAVKTQQGEPYKVFTPFWRTIRALSKESIAGAAPTSLCAPDTWPRSQPLDDAALLPTDPDWAGGMREAWQPGETGARQQLSDFLDERVADYPSGRDRPDRIGTARLSPHLHFGELGPRQVWQATMARAERSGRAVDVAAESFLREIGWREFTHHLLFHWPTLPDANWKKEFDRFSWRDDPKGLRAWQRGRTGYPIVDAGMRELWQTGWMHNRVRMIAASFLIKDLLIDWRCGERWFWDTLVDADLAQNAASWQWVAGSGADAAPYFRIFNPTLQGKKFDPDGAYVRRYVPELANLPSEHIHAPWAAPVTALAKAGIRLGETYPAPIVDHAGARDRALAAYKAIRSQTSD